MDQLNLQGKIYLVTGGCGYVGNRLVQHLLNSKAQVLNPLTLV
jgi:NAD(P)-dependent dehydrogenase (short-subunit alcohol dehydrogenase family)